MSLAFVAGFPCAIGILALVAAFSRSGVTDGAFPLGLGLVLVAGVLIVLGIRSGISIAEDAIAVRFFGVRETTVRFAELASATFGMAFPSISYRIAFTDRSGRRALLHANWWCQEPALLAAAARGLVASDAPMDRSTARIVSKALHIPRPKARIVHRALLRKDRTW